MLSEKLNRGIFNVRNNSTRIIREVFKKYHKTRIRVVCVTHSEHGQGVFFFFERGGVGGLVIIASFMVCHVCSLNGTSPSYTSTCEYSLKFIKTITSLKLLLLLLCVCV